MNTSACGTANVFRGIDPKAGRHFTKVTATRCSAEFADYLLEVAASYLEADTINQVVVFCRERIWGAGHNTIKRSRH